MRGLAGRTAFVTGGAGGIGLSMASAFAQAGMKVMIADIETDALDAAVENLRRITPDIDGSIGVTCCARAMSALKSARAAATVPNATAPRSRSIRRARRRRWSPKSPKIFKEGSIPPTSPRA
jgi:NAD(P)-dependent dehydrogenase (short-subunit alcohol dehydrogenase family)